MPGHVSRGADKYCHVCGCGWRLLVASLTLSRQRRRVCERCGRRSRPPSSPRLAPLALRMLLSAIMPPQVRKLARDVLRGPVVIAPRVETPSGCGMSSVNATVPARVAEGTALAQRRSCTKGVAKAHPVRPYRRHTRRWRRRWPRGGLLTHPRRLGSSRKPPMCRWQPPPPAFTVRPMPTTAKRCWRYSAAARCVSL